MTDGSKAIQGLACSIFGILTFAITYGFFNVYFSNIVDTVQKTLSWFSYGLIILLVVLIVPALLIMSVDSEATIVSAFMGLGSYCIGLLIMAVAWPAADAISGMVNNFFAYGSQLVGLFMLAGILLVLFVVPYVIAIIPQTTKEAIGNITGMLKG